MRKGLLSFALPVICIALIAGVIEKPAAFIRKSASSPNIVNTYRNIGVAYDSMRACCTYGEMCLPNKDSLVIQYQTWYYLPPIDTLQNSIYFMSKTQRFPVDDTTKLRIFRFLSTQIDTTYKYYLPNDIAYVMELHNAVNSDKIAVLDSVGFLHGKGSDSTQFPSIFGTLNEMKYSFEFLNYTIGDYCQGVDSVYLQFRVIVINGGNYPYCSLYDENYGIYKFSDMLVLPDSKMNLATTSRASVKLDVFPNPFNASTRMNIVLEMPQNVIMKLFSLDGKLIKNMYEGYLPAGTNVIPFNLNFLPSGVYQLVLLNDQGKKIAYKQIVLQK